jgi:RNA polymerase sigma factor (sigma-70 family)
MHSTKPTLLATGPARRALATLALTAGDSDEAQDVLLRALLEPPAVRTSWTAWFHGALRLRKLEMRRTEGRRRFRERHVARHESSACMQNDREDHELRQVLELGLAGFDSQTRSILRDHYWRGVSLTAIAQQLGCDLGVVKRRHAGALSQLRAQLGDPSIERRDWAALPWILASFALAAGALGWFAQGPADGTESAPREVAMLTLTPATPYVESVPASLLVPCRPAASTLPSSVPMTPLQPARPVESVQPQDLAWEFAVSIASL